MTGFRLTTGEYRNRVLGGLRGKSAGVTLGLQHRGRATALAVRGYDPVPGQPSASVAIDFPLAWLEVLQRVGPAVAAEDLAVALLEHLDLIDDEYAYAILNLKRGLPPPACGGHSNWYAGASGAVARADFWAMAAPASPQLAASLAWHDATLDHSQDGVWAAMLLAAMGSAAFALADPLELLAVGLAMIPRQSRTSLAVRAAVTAARRGANWAEARAAVVDAAPAEYPGDAAWTAGFTVLGLFYGAGDFAAALTSTVSCGGDTEASGAAAGALAGIRSGAASLPESFVAPLQDLIVPGLRLRDLDVPHTMTEFADRLVAAGTALCTARAPHLVVGDAEPPLEMAAPAAPEPAPAADSEPAGPVPAAPDDEPETVTAVPAAEAEPAAPGTVEQAPPVADAAAGSPAPVEVAAEPPAEPAPDAGTAEPVVEAATVASEPAPEPPAWADSSLVRPLLAFDSTAMTVPAGPYTVTLDPNGPAAVAPGETRAFTLTVVNNGSTSFSGTIGLAAPQGWHVTMPPELGARQVLTPNGGTFRCTCSVLPVANAAHVGAANAVFVKLVPAASGEPASAEFRLLGAGCWYIVGPFANSTGEGFDKSYGPEDRPDLNETYQARLTHEARWERHAWTSSVLDLEPLFQGSAGVLYGRTTYVSPTARPARLVTATNCGAKAWFNRTRVLQRNASGAFQPQLGGGPWSVDVELAQGENLVMVKWVRGAEPFRASVTISDREGRGLPEVTNSAW